MDITLIFSILIVLVVLLLFFAAVLIFRATMYGRLPPQIEQAAEGELPVESTLVAEHLASVLRVQSVSENDPGKNNPAAFDTLHATLERMYPRLHATLKLEKVNGHSLLYTWTGRAAELDPVAFMAHLDVVPVDPATLKEWTHPPFAGVVADGMVWGRGALDTKSSLVTMMEAVEGLIKAGYQPERTLILAFGHDEEIGGWQGARCIVDLLEKRGVRLAAVIDEGGAIMEGMVPGVTVPVALVGMAEKGHASVELTVEAGPGHAAVPSRHTAIGILARAIARLEENPMPPRLTLVKQMFADLGVFLPFRQRLAFANTWLFGGTILKRLQAAATTNALVRTTMAATVIQGGVKDNVLPSLARAVINCRMLPGDTSQALIEHIRKVVNDEAVQIILPEGSTWEASQVSPVSSPIYQNLSKTIRQVFPEAAVAPFIMIMATDSRHFTRLSDNIYRFSPYLLNMELYKTVHGIDERISVEGLGRMVRFYSQLAKSWTTIVGTAE